MSRLRLRAALILAAFSLPTIAAANTASGSVNGLRWRAESYVVGQGSTAAIAAGGSPIYAGPGALYSGVVALSLTYPSGTYSCTGTLLPDRQSILTAAHCAIGFPSMTAYFYGGADPDTNALSSPAATAVQVSQIFLNPSYTGEVIDQNDVAVLRLSQVAPAFAVSYGLYGGADLTGRTFNMAGYGSGSTVGGALGYNTAPGLLRQGDNRYDYRTGDADFAGQLIAALREDTPGIAPIDNLYLADLDNGMARNDAACVVAASFGLSGGKYCNLGLGAREVGVAPGDSGSAQFVDGLIASITSFGLSFESDLGDIDDAANGTFGEFGGLVPILQHRAFIESVMVASPVPEPATWGMLLAGFGLAGAAVRRRGASAARA